MQKKIALAVTVASVLALSACKKEPPAELPPAPQSTTNQAPAPRPTGAIPGTQEHFRQVMAGRDTILFDTDMFNIDAQDQAALREQANYLTQYPNIRATIEGHCDERGTAEYNLALGEKRALAAKTYLVSLGVPADRLRTVSYGKEFPFDPGHDEGAWLKNRRAHFVVTSK
jgi:peptidoglycan-associated lipoprotein